MKRWNGWGDINTDYQIPVVAQNYITSILGVLTPQPDATYDTVLKSVPASHLPAHRLVDVSPEARLAHAYGQSMEDWIALRSGRVGPFPDGVAYPRWRKTFGN